MGTHLKTILVIFLLFSLLLLACGNNSTHSDEIQEDHAIVSTLADESYAKADMGKDKVQESLIMNEQANKSVRFVPPTIVSESTSTGNASISNFIATSAALSGNDGKRKLIRTASMRFKVKDVVQATASIESIILRKHGLIMNSSIANTKQDGASYNISKDSMLVISYNELTGNLSLRVPKDLLDETLREIAPLAMEIDYRVLRARDETFNIIWNNMTEIRKQRKAQRLGNSIASRSGKLGDVVNAEYARESAEETADQVKLDNMILEDEIEFSNIDIQLYQDKIENSTLKASQTDITAYEPGFGTKALDGLSNGWSAICFFALILINIWPLLIILLAVSIFIIIRHKRSKEK